MIIGLIYTFNSVYEYSKEIFSRADKYYYSTHVKKEADRIFDRKNEEYELLLRHIVKNLKKLQSDQFISNSKIHSLINKINRIGKFELEEMHKAFENVWQNLGFGENQEIDQIILKLTEFINEIYSKFSDRKENIEELIIEIPNHTFKDKCIEKIIKEKLREILHDKDEDILFDLNEYSNKHPELDLCFVSWDDNFIEAVKILLNQLSFKKYIGRHESKLK